MGYNSSLIDSIKSSFSVRSIENYYHDKISGKNTLSLTSIPEYQGDEIIRMELYFINYLENVNTSIDFNKFVLLVQNCFHNIAVLHFRSYTFENNDTTFNYYGSKIGSEFITERLKYLKHFKTHTSSDQNTNLNSWNNRFSHLYAILKHLADFNFESHCDQCRSLAGLMDSCSASRLVSFFGLVNKARILESVFTHLFDKIASCYWNYELLLVAFTNSILKNLIIGCIQAHKSHPERNKIANQILHSFLECRNNYFELDGPYMDTFLRILGNFAMNAALHHSNLFILSDDPNITFNNLFMSIVLAHIVKACEASRTNKDLYGGRFALKNQARSEFIYLKVFVEAFIKALSDQLSKGSEVSFKLANISSFLDIDTYNFLIRLKFTPNCDENVLLEYRVGVVLLYMIALHNQIASIRLSEVSYMRLIFSLPWSPALLFCTTDQRLKYILPDFKKVIIECFGAEISICNCINYSFNNLLNECTVFFINATLRLNTDDQYYSHLFSFSTLTSNSLAMLDRSKTKSHVFSYSTNLIYDTITKLVLTTKNLSNHSASKNVKVRGEPYICSQEIANLSQNTHYNWLYSYFRVSYLYNKTICYLAIMDSLITAFIAQEPPDLEKLNLNDIYLSTHVQDECLGGQRELSSNFLALNQNPLNLLLRIPLNVLLHLFRLRPFGNLLVVLLSKLNKYIYEGISSFIASTPLQIDFFQLSALQSASIVNVVIELCNKSDKDTLKMLRSLLFVLLSKNPSTYDFILNSGLPPNPHIRFVHELFGPEVPIKHLVDNYTNLLRLLMDYSEEWEKSDIVIKNDSASFNRSLEPLDKYDLALFHLYSIHLLALESETSKENYEVSTIVVHIESVIKVFWEFIQNNTDLISSNVFKNSISVIVKLHYLYPQFTKKSTETLSTIINMETDADVKSTLEEVNKMIKMIEYNEVMGTDREK